MSIIKRAIVFGTTHLVIVSMEHLLTNGWEIKLVITEDDNVVKWCNKNSISHKTMQDAYSLKPESCYLFSIINPHIIPQELLKFLKTIKAINYHDSLLPKYAGLNSTTWAILNNEKFHGVTWHEIVNELDQGEVYFQQTIPIYKYDTAFDLNIKCTQAALAGFDIVLNHLEQNSLIGIKQDISKRTYFGRLNIPENYGYITSKNNNDYINLLLNSLNFGEKYINPISTPKIKIGNISYIVEKPFLTKQIYEINTSSCIFRNMYGHNIDINTVISKFEDFNLTEEEIKQIKFLKGKEYTNYHKLLHLLNAADIESGLLDSTPLLKSTDKEHTVDISISSIEHLSFLLSVILMKFGCGQTFIKLYRNDNRINNNITNIIETINILGLSCNTLDFSCNVGFADVNKKIAEYSFELIKDFGYRYKLNLCSEFAIVDGEIDSVDEHKVKFIYFKDKILVNYNDVDSAIVGVIIKCIRLLNALLFTKENSSLKIKTIPLLSKTDYEDIIYNWNNNYRSFKNETIKEAFERQALFSRDKLAISYKDKKISYGKLNEISNQLAHYLRDKYDILPDTPIVVMIDRSELLLVAILAILKVGACYVPIDSRYPDERINHILKDTDTKIILTNKLSYPRLNQLQKVSGNKDDKYSIEIIDRLTLKLKSYPLTNLSTQITNQNLAYIIYTSGTTGKPKGVMIEHKCVINYLENLRGEVFGSTIEKIDFSTNIGFDLTVTTTLGALYFGHELYVYANDVQDLSLYKKHLIKNKITLIKIIPSYFNLLIGFLSETSLNKVILGGEKTNKENISKINKKDLIIYDEYGPTEATVGSSIYEIYNNGTVSKLFLIGKAYHNYTFYILDNNLVPLPIGVIGELYIGGDSLARGYLHQPKLTEEKFIKNPFQSDKDKQSQRNERLYKTGDLCRYTFNGNIEYVGREDHQAKINGHRVEPKEIEHVINQYPNIKESVVLTNKQINKDSLILKEYLVAYYVSDDKLNETYLFNYLTNQLPNYMVPEVLIHIIEKPLTINGKLDKLALPGPNLTIINNYVAPRNNFEAKICNIYAEILKLSQQEVGIYHDFFMLGGNSISAIHLVYKLQRSFKITLNDVYNFRIPVKIAELAPLVKDNLAYKLKQQKLVYHLLSSYEKEYSVAIKIKKLEYLQDIDEFKFSKSAKNIKNVLLSGANGHFGAHILYELLKNTKYKLYLPIRASSYEEGYSRINKKFKYYFNHDLNEYKDRIYIFVANIEKPQLQISAKDYTSLASDVDSIIHCAALVKHYGEPKEFYLANVQTTINLLELCKQTTLKDFHYISTTSVLTNGYIPNCHYYIFTETDTNICLKNRTNLYFQSKYEGELQVIMYRKFDINSNIYRVGNLAMNSQSHRIQENIEENAFFIRIKTILNLGMLTKEISEVEISPVDQAALAVVKIFDKVDLSNKVYHISNPYSSDLFKLLKNNNINIKCVKFNSFVNKIFQYLNSSNKLSKHIELFMLHQLWLEETNLDTLTKIVVCQDLTNSILSKLDFEWLEITGDMLSEIVKKSYQ